jgi:hypothetical protein
MKKTFISLVLIGMAVGASAAGFSSTPRGIAGEQLQSAVPAGVAEDFPTPDAPGASGSVPGNDAAALDALPTESEIADAVKAQGFDFNNVGIVITYFSPSNQQVTYQHNPYGWWYPASTTKLVVLTYIYHYAYLHRKPGEDFDQEIIAADKSYISKMILASDNDATTYLAKKYGEDNILHFPRRVLGYYGIETGWKKLAGPDRVTARGMNLLISYIYDDRDAEAIPLPVKKEIRKWLELPKIGQLDIQNKPIESFLNNPDMPNPYDPQSGLTVGMKSGWTDDAGSGNVICFNWRPQGSRWTAAIYRKGNWAYFGQIGDLYRDLFLLFRDKR